MFLKDERIINNAFCKPMMLLVNVSQMAGKCLPDNFWQMTAVR